MSADESHTIPDHIASRVARLINEAEDMRQQGADSLKQIYSDLRDDLREMGWVGSVVSAEVAALKGAIAELRMDEATKAKREEKGERKDDYVSMLSRARAREGQSYAEAKGVEPKLVKQVVDGMQTEIGRKALVAALDIMIEREEAETGDITEPQEQPSLGTGDDGDSTSNGAVLLPTPQGAADGTAHRSVVTGGESAAAGETGMVPVTGRERPMLRPEAASTEARFETVSLHQFQAKASEDSSSVEPSSQATPKAGDAIPPASPVPPSRKINPNCRRAAKGEQCALSHSQASCWKCQQIADEARRAA